MYAFHALSDLAEDDKFRSRYIQALVQTPAPLLRTKRCKRSGIPKFIIQFWHDSDAVPGDVQQCLDSWKLLENYGFKRFLFDDDKARNFISTTLGSRHLTAYDLCYHPAMRCDYFRLCYLLAHGGFYVDADELYQGTPCNHFFDDRTLKLQPLCYDKITGTMIKTDFFIKERRHSPNWTFYVNNNPIISPANHPVIRLALERATRILLNSVEQPEIQSTTGPGNLTASLVAHNIQSNNSSRDYDFLILPDWDTISISPWPLSYRSDDRNWRLFQPPKFKEGFKYQGPILAQRPTS